MNSLQSPEHPPDRAAVGYFCTVITVYILLCFLVGHPLWIFTMFFQNTTSDLFGETPRMLAATYYANAMEAIHNGEDYAEIINQMVVVVMG